MLEYVLDNSRAIQDLESFRLTKDSLQGSTKGKLCFTIFSAADKDDNWDTV